MAFIYKTEDIVPFFLRVLFASVVCAAALEAALPGFVSTHIRLDFLFWAVILLAILHSSIQYFKQRRK